MEKLCQHCSHIRKKSRRAHWRLPHRHSRMAMVSIFFSQDQPLNRLRNHRSFLGQCPPTLLALALVIWKLKVPLLEESKHSQLAKLRRIDFLGAILLSVSIVCGLTVLDLGGQRMSWTSTKVLTLFAVSVVSGTLFLVIEGFWAKEPIFPLRLLLNRDVVTSYINLAFQTGAQGAVCIYSSDDKRL